MPRDAPFAKVILPAYNYKTEAPTLHQISAMNRQLVGSGFVFLLPHHQVLQRFKAQKVYINWYIFMQLSEKWPRVHVGNNPILFFSLLVWKYTSFAIKCQKFDEKRPQDPEKIKFSVFVIFRAQWVTMYHMVDIKWPVSFTCEFLLYFFEYFSTLGCIWKL